MSIQRNASYHCKLFISSKLWMNLVRRLTSWRFHRAIQATLACRGKMALRDLRWVEWHELVSVIWNEVNFHSQCLIIRESKGQEVCQDQQECRDFRLVLHIVKKKLKLQGMFLSLNLWLFLFSFIWQGDEGPLGPAGLSGAEVSADWISPAAHDHFENTVTQ